MMKRFKFLALVAALGLPLAACDEGSQSTTIVEGSVVGTVTVEGTGLSGVTVTLSSGASTATDASGGYSFTGVPAGSYTVSITAQFGDVIFPSTSKGVVIQSAGETVTANFDGQYVRTSSIAGVVTASGMTLSGVTVSLSGTESGSMVTTTDGGFGFNGLRAGSYTVSISGFDANKYNFNSTSQSVSLGTGASEVVSFAGTAAETGVITATVNIDGAAANGITLTLSTGDTEVTNSSGQASFSGLATGTYAVTVTNPDDQNISFDNLTQNATIAEIGGTASVEFEGTTIANASIGGRVYNEMNGTPGYQAGEDMAWADQTVMLSNGSEDMTDADGLYSFTGLASGDYTVSFENPDPDNLIFTDLDVDVDVTNPNQAYTVDFVSMYRADNSVSGRVWLDLAADGEYTSADEPAADFEMTAENADLGLSFSATTDADGKYMFDGLRSGTWTITCVTCPADFGGRQWNWTAPTDVELGQGVDATANFIGTVTGYTNSMTGSLVLTDPDETASTPWALSGVEITLVGPMIPGAGDPPTATTTTDADGNFMFDGLAPGNYEVTIDQAAVEADYNVDLTSDATVVVNVADELGATATVPAFTFAINAYTVTVQTVFGANGAANQMTYAGDVVALYQSEELDAGGPGSGNLLDTETTDADGYVSFDVPAANVTDDFVLFTSLATVDAAIQPDAIILEDGTIEHRIDPLLLEQVVTENHNLRWGRVWVTGRFVEQDGTPVSDAIRDNSRVGLVSNIGWALEDDISDFHMMAGVDTPNDDLFVTGTGAVTGAITEDVGEFNYYVASPQNPGGLPEYLAVTGNVTSVSNPLVGDQVAFTGTTAGAYNAAMVDGTVRNIDLGDVVVSYPNPNIRGRVWHEANDEIGYQDGDDDFADIGDVTFDVQWDDDGDGDLESHTGGCNINPLNGLVNCLVQQSVAGINITDVDEVRIAVTSADAEMDLWFIPEGGQTIPVEVDADKQGSDSDVTSMIDDTKFEKDFGDEPFSYKFAGNTLKIQILNELGADILGGDPGITGGGTFRDGNELPVVGVTVTANPVGGLGIDPGDFPKSGATLDLTPYPAAGPVGTARLTNILEGLYEISITGVDDGVFLGALEDIRLVMYDETTGDPYFEYDITSGVSQILVRRDAAFPDAWVEGVDILEAQYRGGELAGYAFDNDDDDDVIDPNEVFAGATALLQYEDPITATTIEMGTFITGADGIYTFSDLWEGFYTLSLNDGSNYYGFPTQRFGAAGFGFEELDNFGSIGADAATPATTATVDILDIGGLFGMSDSKRDTDFEIVFIDGEVRFTVLDNGGTPIPNAQITLSSCAFDGVSTEGELPGGFNGSGPGSVPAAACSAQGAIVHTFTTDANGYVSVRNGVNDKDGVEVETLSEGYWLFDLIEATAGGATSNEGAWVVRLLHQGDIEARIFNMD